MEHNGENSARNRTTRSASAIAESFNSAFQNLSSQFGFSNGTTKLATNFPRKAMNDGDG